MHNIPEAYLTPGGEFIVGELDGRIVALAAFRRESDGRASVHRVGVHPALQRRGVGRALMAELEDRARRAEIAFFHLDTSIDQVAAQTLYLADVQAWLDDAPTIRKNAVLAYDFVFTASREFFDAGDERARDKRAGRARGTSARDERAGRARGTSAPASTASGSATISSPGSPTKATPARPGSRSPPLRNAARASAWARA